MASRKASYFVYLSTAARVHEWIQGIVPVLHLVQLLRLLVSHRTAGGSASVGGAPGACCQPCAASQPIASGCQLPT
jgi:hypothetical protein